MKNATHRVVILKNLNSEIVSQAIFFLKEESTVPESKIITEAEKIVAKYMSSGIPAPTQPHTSNRRGNIIRLICACVFAVTLAVGIAYFA